MSRNRYTNPKAKQAKKQTSNFRKEYPGPIYVTCFGDPNDNDGNYVIKCAFCGHTRNIRNGIMEICEGCHDGVRSVTSTAIGSGTINNKTGKLAIDFTDDYLSEEMIKEMIKDMIKEKKQENYSSNGSVNNEKPL